VRDRLSFRRFCGIPLDEETPDHSSIWRFRQTIEQLGLAEKQLAEVNRQLNARGLMIKCGTLVDATIIEAAVRPLPHEDGQVYASDLDASFTVKNDKTYFGYKAHLAVDEASGIARQAEMTSADLHDSQRDEAMIEARRTSLLCRQGLRQQRLARQARVAGDLKTGSPKRLGASSRL
jgi:IS5 family transposase